MEAKRFFSKIAGARFIMPDGFEITFHGGRFDFEPKKYPGNILLQTLNGQTDERNNSPRALVYFNELQNLVDSGNPLIFDEKNAAAAVKQPMAPVATDVNAFSESAILNKDAQIASSGVVGRTTGDANTGTSTPGNVNESTIDPNIAAAVLKSVGPGSGGAMSAVDIARAKAAQKN